MAVNEPFDPLGRGARALRRTPEPGWIELSGRIMARVRATVMPAEPILVFPASPAADGSRTWVSTRVVTAELRRAVAGATTALSDVGVVLDRDRLTEVHVEVVCAYGVDLHTAGDRVIAAVHSVVDDLRLADPDASSRVEVLVTDVVAGDPRLV